jgi:hypothetical protein
MDEKVAAALHKELWTWMAEQAKNGPISAMEKINWPKWKEVYAKYQNMDMSCFPCYISTLRGADNCSTCPIIAEDGFICKKPFMLRYLSKTACLEIANWKWDFQVEKEKK